jgi:hypothetical protein
VQAEDIITLKKIARKCSKRGIRNKRHKTIDASFAKTQRNEAVNIELTDKNSQYIYVCKIKKL